ncbi:MAG: hypothetical protein EGP96_20190 [Roseburia inulinivorans]|nr:hypothetical protein [Roseburia inulinivorans]
MVRPEVGSVSRRLRKTDKNGNPRLSLQFSGEHATFSIKPKGGVPSMIRLALVEDDELYRSQLREYIDKYSAVSGEKFTVTEFSDGDEIALGYKAVSVWKKMKTVKRL